jgi:hypothetical protein
MIGRFNPATEEFVLVHRLLKERTADDPNRVAAALDESSDLAAGIVRLHEIKRAYERHQDFSPRRLIVQAHPEFSDAVDDFQDRWANAYDEVRRRIYNREALRVSDEFLRCYRILIERTGDDPTAVKSLRKQDLGLSYLITRLENIRDAFDNLIDYSQNIHPRFNGKEFLAKTRELRRVVANVPRQFHDALEDFRLRWSDPHEMGSALVVDLDDLLPLPSEAEVRAARSQFAPDWLQELIDGLPDMPFEEGSDETDSTRHFDPSRDSAADAIERAESAYEDTAWNCGLSDYDYPPGEAFTWMHETVGVDLHEIERRWKEFPVIIVPQHISDGYGLEEPRGLYASLTQIRLAYMIGADLAAIALCRSVTERMIRFHYAFDVPNAKDSRKTKLTGEGSLIEIVELREDRPFLRCFNLTAKVKEAHRILHLDSNSDDIPHRDRDRGLVTQWVIVLDEMIKHAPFNNTTDAH